MKRTVLLAVFAIGCGGSSGDPPEIDAPIDPPDAAVVTRTVTGTMNARHVTLAGDVIEPFDLSTATIAALVPPTFASLPGVGTAEGTFSIAGVPDGEYYLQFGDRYIVTSRSSIDLGFDILGRPDRLAATTPTPLIFNVGGLQAWQTTDELQMSSPGNGMIAFAMQTNATAGIPGPGATSLTGFTFDLSRADIRPLIDGTAGDLVTMTQFSTQTIAGRTIRAVTRSFEPAAFTVANGGTATLAGSFVVPPQTATMDVIWDRPAFDADLRARSPGSEPINYSILATSVLPGAATRGLYSPAADLVIFEPGFLTDATTVTTAWPYGDPYPVAATRTVSAVYFTHRFVQLGTASPLAVFARMDVDHDRATLPSQATISPLIGAVVDPKVNGNDAFGSLAAIGMTPTITWSPPAIGIASRYYVDVLEIANVAGATEIVRRAAFLETSETSVSIPPGVLVPGASYVFSIGARASSNVDPDATPLRASLPEGFAEITTAMVTP